MKLGATRDMTQGLEWDGLDLNTWAGASMLNGCCRCTASFFTLGDQDAAGWLMAGTREICSLMPPGSSCWMADVTLGERGTPWRVESFGSAGYSADGAERLMEEALAGFPHDDSVHGPARRFGVPVPGVFRRTDLFEAGAWPTSLAKRFGDLTGVHDFVRAVMPIDAEPQSRWLLIQVGGRDGGWKATDQVVEALSAVSHGAASAFVERFVRIERVRRDLMSKVGPASRQMLPLLAEGLSETQIARVVHRSAHTIHDHVKQIYRSLNVASRLELRALWMGEPMPSGRRCAGASE